MHISFVIPTYNRKNLIKKSINSILKVFGKNFEIIIVDDNSSDNTAIYIKNNYKAHFKTKKIKYFYLKKNIGVTGAKNFGYQKSKNNFVVFLDSDDQFYGSYKNFIQILKKYNKVPIIFFKCYENKPSKKNIIGRVFNKDKLLSLSDYIINYSYGEALTVINKKICKNILPYKNSLRGFEGFGCIRLISKFGNAVLISKPFRIYNTLNYNRLSNDKNFKSRVGYIYKGYKIIWKKYRANLKNLYLLKLFLRLIKFKILSTIYD